MTTPGEPCPCCLQAQEDIKAAVAEARAPLVEALRRVQWVSRPGHRSWCPICRNWQSEGHGQGCPLAAALAKETP